MTIVLDTNVWVSALHFKVLEGTPAHVLRRVYWEDTLAVCPEIEAEIVRVLTQRFGRDQSQVISLLSGFLSGAVWVQIAGSVRVCRDPQDDMVLECAQRAGAELIETGDKDLLVLGSFEGIRICDACGVSCDAALSLASMMQRNSLAWSEPSASGKTIGNGIRDDGCGSGGPISPSRRGSDLRRAGVCALGGDDSGARWGRAAYGDCAAGGQ